MSNYSDPADGRILKAAHREKYTQDLITGQKQGAINLTHYRLKEGWDLDSKYTIAKKEAVDSFDWFIDEWNKVGWGINSEDYDYFKKIWMLAGSPFLSHINPSDGTEANHMYYLPTSRTIDVNTRTTSENKDYYIGAPDIIVMAHPKNESMLSEEASLGPFVLLDELGHALQFAYPSGIKGKNITGDKDMSTFVAADEIMNLLKHKEIGYDVSGNQRLVSTKGYSKKKGYSEELTDSLLFIHAQQLKGDPFLDSGVVNMFDNPEYYNNRGHFDLRYALASEASGQWLTGEAQAHQMFAPALHLTYADLKTSGGLGDGELSSSDVHQLNKSAMGKKVVSDLIYRYGVGQEDINYGTVAAPSIVKKKYQASSTDPKLVQYNERITTDDDRYRLAKYNQDKYLKKAKKEYNSTMQNLTKWRSQQKDLHPNIQLERFIKERNERN